jgi:nucleoside-diphosphate-sugar epimerase
MRRKIFITGAAGKMGIALLELLFERGGMAEADVTCLCRDDSCRERLSRFPVHIVEGDASDEESLRHAYRGEEIIIHLSSIFHVPAVLEACREGKRLIAISSTGVFSRFRRTAAEIARCESLIESSGLSRTILRPTMIYGTPDDRNISRLVRLVARNPIVPLPGGGKARFQPVHVSDLARCISACLENDASIGRSYNVPGGSAHSLGEIVRIIARLLRKRVVTVPIPLAPALLAARVLRLRIDPEQIGRLREDKTFSYEDAAADLGYAPMRFEEGLRLQLEAMGLAVERG